MQKKVYDMTDAFGKKLIDRTSTLSDVAEVIDNLSHTHKIRNRAGKIVPISTRLAVGNLDTRQPRNQMGDVAITKVGKNPNTGKFYNDVESGNSSRMNYADAIRAQDADFDFDKTFKYVAAPGEYWTQVNKNAGMFNETVRADERMRELFDPYNKESRMAVKVKEIIEKKYPELSFDADRIEVEVNAARGQFIKMHQTVTYLSNIFKENPVVATFTKNGVTWEVRISDRVKYHTTVSNIGEMGKEFIDMYKNLPSLESTEFGNLRRMQNKILFGEHGMFDLYSTDKRDASKMNKVSAEGWPGLLNGTSKEFINAKKSIVSRIIDPLNRYLKYNKGMEEDPSGISVKASLKSYNDAYYEMAVSNLKTKDRSFIEEGIDLVPAFEAMNRYFSETMSPYDVAMRGLHKTYKKTTSGQVEWTNKNLTELRELEAWIKEGNPDMKKSDAEVRNELFDKTIREIVKDDARALEAIDLGKKINKIRLDIQERKRFLKTVEHADDIMLNNLNLRLARAEEALSVIENSLSFRYGDKINNPKEQVNLGSNQAVGVWRNYKEQAVVIVDRKGNIREVIEPGRRNTKPIYKNTHKVIVNGSRFKVANTGEQKGLEILHQAFANLPVIQDANGRWIRIDKYELDKYIQADFIQMRTKVGDIKKRKPNQTRYEKSDRALEIEEALFNFIFEAGQSGNNEVYRKALIMRALAPEVLKTQFSINRTYHGNATFDKLYYENPLSRDMMSLLVKVASGERKGDKIFAEEVLRDIEINKNVAFLKVENVDANIDLIKARMYSQPIEIENNGTLRNLTLDRTIYEQLRSGSEQDRNAARILIDFAQGEMIDPRILYKATKIMEKATNLSQDQHWGSEKYLTNPDGTIRKTGRTVVRVNEIDKITKKSGIKEGLEMTAEQKTIEALKCMLK